MASLQSSLKSRNTALSHFATKHENSDIDDDDDDVLHVVTNVYTIPIVKSSSAGNGPFVSSPSSHNLKVTTSCDQQLCKRPLASEPPLPAHAPEGEQCGKAGVGVGAGVSKFQIRSIVEIYEKGVEEQEADRCTLKQSGHFEETTTREVVTEGNGSCNAGYDSLLLSLSLPKHNALLFS